MRKYPIVAFPEFTISDNDWHDDDVDLILAVLRVKRQVKPRVPVILK